MRATSFSALVSGVMLGVLLGYLGRLPTKLVDFLLPFVFFTSVLVAVVGLPQLKEMLALQWKHGSKLFTMPVESGDMRRVFAPVWLRVVIWFLATGIVALV